MRGVPRTATWTLTQLLNYDLVIIPWEDLIYTPRPPYLGAHFYAWLNAHFCDPGVCFFQKVAMTWNFCKVAINFCDSVNPLWVSSRFSRSKHNELWSRRHCIKSVTVQFFWPVMLHQRLQLKQTNKTKLKKTAGTGTGVQDGPTLPAVFCDVIMSATSAWSSLLCTCSIGGTKRAKETRHV